MDSPAPSPPSSSSRRGGWSSSAGAAGEPFVSKLPTSTASWKAPSAALSPPTTPGYGLAREKRKLQEFADAVVFENKRHYRQDPDAGRKAEESATTASKLEELEARYAVLQVQLGKETDRRVESQRQCKALEIELHDVIARNAVLEAERARMVEFNRALNQAVMRLNGKNLDLHEYAVACEEMQALTQWLGEAWEDLGESSDPVKNGLDEEAEAEGWDAESETADGWSDAGEADEVTSS